MEKKIWLSLAHMGSREQDFIKEAFDTNWVVPLGPNVDAFEKAIENYIDENKKVVVLINVFPSPSTIMFCGLCFVYM